MLGLRQWRRRGPATLRTFMLGGWREEEVDIQVGTWAVASLSGPCRPLIGVVLLPSSSSVPALCLAGGRYSMSAWDMNAYVCERETGGQGGGREEEGRELTSIIWGSP